MIDITEIVEVLGTLLLLIFVSFVLPYIKSKTTTEQQKAINEWVKIAVAAAEQLFVGSGRGAEKKEYVVEFLKSHNMTVDMSRIDAMIEAAVYELNNGVIPSE